MNVRLGHEAVVGEGRGLAVFPFLIGKLENCVADPNLVAVRQDVLFHTFAVDECAMVAAQIANPESVLHRLNEAVLAGDGGIADAQLAGRLAADGHFFRGQLENGSFERPGNSAKRSHGLYGFCGPAARLKCTFSFHSAAFSGLAQFR